MTQLSKSVSYADLQGKSVLVSGGASGIGRAIVSAFAAQGAKVAFLDLNDTEARKTIEICSDNPPTYVSCDLKNVEALRGTVAAIAQTQGPVEVLVNNAGNDDRHLTPNVTREYFDDRVAVNLRHYLFLAQAVVGGMAAAGGGAIVNLGSIAWKIGEGDCPIYLACKAAVTGLTRGLAREFGTKGIRVNTVLPGWVMTERQLALWVTPDGEREIDRAQCIKKRLQPEDIAAMVLFLSSLQAKMCTSQDYIVDAGWV